MQPWNEPFIIINSLNLRSHRWWRGRQFHATWLCCAGCALDTGRCSCRCRKQWRCHCCCWAPPFCRGATQPWRRRMTSSLSSKIMIKATISRSLCYVCITERHQSLVRHNYFDKRHAIHHKQIAANCDLREAGHVGVACCAGASLKKALEKSGCMLCHLVNATRQWAASTRRPVVVDRLWRRRVCEARRYDLRAWRKAFIAPRDPLKSRWSRV